MHSLFSLYKCVGSLPFYARRSNWTKAYVRVDKIDFNKQLAFGEYFHTKKSIDNLISGAKSFDWLIYE